MVVQENVKILLNSDYEEVFHAEDIVITANENYLRFLQDEKWGLISRAGNVVVAPNFNSIRCQKNV